MPFCDTCEQYHAPTAMNADGTCPGCGGAVESTVSGPELAAHDETAPWHFKLLVIATVAYLGWRFVQLFV